MNTLPPLLHGTVSVVDQVQEDSHGPIWFGPTKTEAGVRKVAIPEDLIPEIEAHLAAFAGEGRDGLVFPSSNGGPFRRATFYTAWDKARTAEGLPGFRLQDLRHTGNTLAAATGVSLKDLMTRMGHATARTAPSSRVIPLRGDIEAECA
jgi:integrase